jgi:serpin B
MNRSAMVVGCLSLVLGCGSQEAPSADAAVAQASFVRSTLQRSTDPQTDPGAIAATVERNTDFAFALYDELKAEPGNLWFSPFSITTAFAQSWAGARGTTADEIADAFGFDAASADTVHASLNALDAQLDVRDEVITAQISNALWTAPSFTPLPSFLDLLALNYGAGVGVVDFSQPARASEQINTWVSEQTHGKVTDLLTPSALPPQTRLVLTNTVYLRGDWIEQFEPLMTTADTFTRLDGSTVDVPTMYSDGPRPYAEGDDYQAATLQLLGVTGSHYELMVIKPKVDFVSFEASFDRARMNEIRAALTPVQMLLLRIPKLEIDGHFSLKQALQTLGVQQAFEDRADFTGFSSAGNVFIDNALHQATLSVNEAGMEASAATAVVFRDASISNMPEPPPSLVLDRSFLIALVHTETNSVLFLGRISDPSQ